MLPSCDLFLALPALLLAAGSVPHAGAVKLGAHQEPGRSEQAAEIEDAFSSSFLPPGVARDGPPSWLHIAWAPASSDLEGILEGRGQRMAHATLPLEIHHMGGLFGGIGFFTKSLLQDLPQDLADKLQACHTVYTNGGDITRSEGSPGAVWIVVNGEGVANNVSHRALVERRPNRFAPEVFGPNDRAVILGNWWNATQQEFKNESLSSLWLPFFSTSFAERKGANPLQLEQISEERSERRDLGIVYQNSMCYDQREHIWDVFAATFQQVTGQQAINAGKCDGFKNLSTTMPGGNIPDRGASNGPYERSVRKYQKFDFVYCPEHASNNFGYITEKIVNAFLAGAVPVYYGLSSVSKIFNPDAFIEIDVASEQSILSSAQRAARIAKNPHEYQNFIKPGTPIINDWAMRQFLTWHPATWPKYGDFVRRRILEETIRMCNAASR